MANVLSTREAADELMTSPKTLRQFLRQDDTFGGVGSGARYELKRKDLPRLKKRFADWAKGRGTVVARTPKEDDNDGQPGLPLSVLRKRDRATRELIKKQADERVDRLEAMLKERGLHISQTKR